MLPALDIILPCYNPIDGWEKTVLNGYKKICYLLPETKIQIIIVNDGSNKQISEESWSYLKKNIPHLQIKNLPQNKGKGFAVRKGVQLSESDLQIFTDIDFPYLEQDLVNIYQKLCEENCDIVIGHRSTNYYNNVPLSRTLLSKAFRQAIKRLLNLPVTDTQTGLKGFNKKGKAIFVSTTINRYLFDLEFLFLASHQKDISISTQEVTLKDNVQFSSLNPKILFTESFNFSKILVEKILKRDK